MTFGPQNDIHKLERKKNLTDDDIDNIEKVCNKMKSKIVKQKFECEKCKKILKNKYVYSLHTIKCIINNNQSKVLRNKRKNLKLQLYDEIPCNMCDEIFTNKNELRKHKQKHSDKVFKCSSCGRVYNTSKQLKDHKYKVHNKLKQTKNKSIYKTTSVAKKRKIIIKIQKGDSLKKCQRETGASPRRQTRYLKKTNRYLRKTVNDPKPVRINRSATGSGKKPSPWLSAIEDQIIDEISKNREHGIIVDKQSVLNIIVNKCQKQNLKFPENASINSILFRLRKRHRINPKKRITRVYSLNEAVVAQRCIDFIEHVKKVRNTFNIVEPENIWCIDEVGIVESSSGKNQTTWDFISKNEIKLSDTKNPKVHHTVIIMLNATGTKRLVVVFNSKNKGEPKNKHNWEVVNEVYTCNIHSKSWINADIWNEFINEVMWKNDIPQLLQFDEATGHMNMQSIEHLQNLGFKCVITPGETSSFVQPNDYLPNRNFQSNIRKGIRKYISRCITEKKTSMGNPKFNDLCDIIKHAIRNITNNSIYMSFLRCGILTGSFQDFHEDLQNLLSRNKVQLNTSSCIYTQSAIERIQKVKRRGTKSHTAEKYKYICQKCSKEYASKYSKEAKNHEINCKYSPNEINSKEAKSLEQINPFVFHHEIKTENEINLLSSLENESDESDQIEVLNTIPGHRFDIFNTNIGTVTPFPPLFNVAKTNRENGKVRIIDLLGSKRSIDLKEWFVQNGFKVIDDIYGNAQEPSSCGYIAAKAAYTLNTEINWSTCDIFDKCTGEEGKEMIRNFNIILKKENRMYEADWLEGGDIVEIISNLCISNKNEASKVHEYLQDMPLPFDFLLPKLVKIVRDSHLKNIEKQIFIFNTDNSDKQGTHWVTLMISTL